MGKRFLGLLSVTLLCLWAAFFNTPVVCAETATDYNAVPPFVTAGAPPLVMLVMGRDHKLYYEAYNDASDLNDDGVLDVRYNPSIDYYGYFDNFKCYTYSAARFEPSSKTTNGKKCESAASDWSGDFLNYLTMTRMDTMRKVLYGGYRSTDTAGTGGETVLQRVYVPQDAHSWGKEYESVARDKYDIRDYTPLKLPEVNTRHLLASTTLADNGNPLLRVLPNNSHRIWDWVAKERPVVDNSLEVTAAGHYDSHPKSHAEYDLLVNQFANDAHQQGTGVPANGQINGSGNPYGADDDYLNIFKGTIVVAAAGTYEFAVDGDDAVEVIIDGTVVASWYDGHGLCSCKDHKGSIALTSGNHSVEFRHQERTGSDNYYLYWKGADSSNNWQIVPAAKFANLIQTTYDVNYLGSVITDYEVRVKVCDPAISLEANCKQYPNGNYKPVGILQRHGESLWDATVTPPAYKAPKMYFGLMTGSYAKSTSGGVLRKKMGNISDEIETNTTGVFKTTTNGIIQTINKMRIYGFSYPSAGNYEYNKNCGWITSGPMAEGQCRDWGNPIGEVMYEAVRYFAGKDAATSEFDYTIDSENDDDSKLGLPKAAWNNPYDRTDGGFASCSKPFMLVLSDINPSYDSDQLPGVDANFGVGITSDLSALNVKTSATTISTIEGVSGHKFIGQSGVSYDGVCSEKNIAGLGSIRGLCPEEPTKLGSYYSASVAHYGHTADLQTLTDQKITTYGIGLASPLPRIELKVGPDKRLITLVPFGKSVKQDSSGLWTYFPTNTIVDFFVEELTDTYGKFSINYEDVEQGADHDMDCIVRYEYQLIDGSGNNVTDPLLAAKVKITLTSTYAAGGIVQHLGYVISGTTADKTYVEVRDLDTSADNDVRAPFDTGSAVAPLPLTATRTFEPSSAAGTTAAQLLPNPLWYASKWGAYVEKDNTTGPNLQEEWDRDNDGIPDTYFYVTNPLKLEEQLNKSFADIQRRTTSGTAASVISGSRSGEGALFQSVFYPEYRDNSTADNKITWAGSVHASFVDDLGRIREDTNQNKILDKNDKIIVFGKDSDGALVIDKFRIIGAVAEKTNVTLQSSASLKDTYFRLNTVGESFYVWFTIDGSGIDPLLHGAAVIKVELHSTDTAADVAMKTKAAIDSFGAFDVPDPGADTISITNTIPGDVADATVETSSVVINVTQDGAGETTHLDGNAEEISYLWNSNTWLNSISDADIVTQRSYATADHQRYIFTFIDANKDMVATTGEQLPFSHPPYILADTDSLDNDADGTKDEPGETKINPIPLAALTNVNQIYPYIPVNSDSETLPSSPSLTVNLAGGNRDEFLQIQTQRVINYTRGLDQGSATLTTGAGGTMPAFRSRKLDLDKNGSLETTWRLGDIVHSSPTVVNKPREALHLLYKDASYGIFAAKYNHRRTVLYTGANDGMLHAFNGGFYEDRFDVFPGIVAPAVPDGIKDMQYLLQPKKFTAATNTWGPDTSVTAYSLGSELWAYIPYNLLPHLYWPTEVGYGHVYYADLKPRVFDAKIFTEESGCASGPYTAGCIHPGGWGTVLVGGMRLGGGKINIDMNRRDGNVNKNNRTMASAYYILDITNPEAPPTVLGEINFPHLGYTTVYPTVATMKDKVETTGSPNKWYLIFGSGPAEAGGSPGTTSGVALPDTVSNQKAKLYVVDLVELASNKKLKTVDASGQLTEITPVVAPALPQAGYYLSLDNDNNAFISDPITVDFDLDYKADVVYFGTVSSKVATEWGGKLRRIVMKDDINPALWEKNSVLIDLEKNTGDPVNGSYQPITAAPSVGLDPDGNNWVFFGTGRYFIRNDNNITTQQTFYGIKEPRVTSGDSLVNSYAEVTHATMYDSTAIEVNTSTKLVSGGTSPPSGTSTAPKNWNTFLTNTKSFGGWYYNFTDNLERNIGQAALFGDLATFTSYIPSNDICTYEGSSNLYALYYLTGTAPPRAAIHDSSIPNPVNHLKKLSLGTGMVSKPSIHVGRKEGSTIFVQTSEGAILTLDEANPGQTRSGRTSWGYRE